jgi:hypothetical protein
MQRVLWVRWIGDKIGIINESHTLRSPLTQIFTKVEKTEVQQLLRTTTKPVPVAKICRFTKRILIICGSWAWCIN